MAFQFSYTVDQPVARLFGSAQVEWYVSPFYREVGASDWFPVVGTGKMFYLEASDVAIVNAMPEGTTGEKIAKGNAYITLILASVENAPAVYIGQLPTDLEQIITNNLLAASAVADLRNFIEVVMGQSYPVRFSI